MMERAVKWLSCIFLLASMGFLCASFVAGLGYSQWTVAGFRPVVTVHRSIRGRRGRRRARGSV